MPTHCIYPCSKGISDKIQISASQGHEVIEGSLHIILFSATVVVAAFTPANAPEIEPKCRRSGILIGPDECCDYVVLHIPAIKRMWVTHDHSLAPLSAGKKPLQDQVP